MNKANINGGSAQRIARSAVWNFFSRDVALRYCRMAGETCADRGDIAKAAEVFECLGLDLAKLSQIFVAVPQDFYNMPKERRPRQPAVAHYEDLGLCRTQDEAGWISLAQLANKEIRLIRGESVDGLVSIYYPNGEVKKIGWYQKFFKPESQQGGRSRLSKLLFHNRAAN